MIKTKQKLEASASKTMYRIKYKVQYSYICIKIYVNNLFLHYDIHFRNYTLIHFATSIFLNVHSVSRARVLFDLIACDVIYLRSWFSFDDHNTSIHEIAFDGTPHKRHSIWLSLHRMLEATMIFLWKCIS